MENWFRSFLKSDPPAAARDKFLARLLGLFSEDIVRIWCKSQRSPYRDLGRPRIFLSPGARGHTLDFTLQSRHDGSTYVAEMKCWVEYQGYQYLTLCDADQLDALEGPAFDAFLAVAREPSRCQVTIDGEPQAVSGAILVWGDVADSGRAAVQRVHKLSAVLSLREIVDDLLSWKDEQYQVFLTQRREWCLELFERFAKGELRTKHHVPPNRRMEPPGVIPAASPRPSAPAAHARVRETDGRRPR